uniref:Uncharacterized protein n=1 Tax=Panagrolaimus superbus TaxID=310955 RepID=A0A914YZF6_9BILA
MKDNVDHHWGDYYMDGRRNKAKKNWILETIFSVNQMIPTFNELFDEETFYVFAFFVVIAAGIFVYLMTYVFKIKVKEYPITVDRPWRDWKPANAFEFPWQKKKEEEEHVHQD